MDSYLKGMYQNTLANISHISAVGVAIMVFQCSYNTKTM